MIADRRPVLIVERVTVRCDECPRQVSVYASNNKLLGHALADVGWDGEQLEVGVAHYCPEHVS
jgi:hypothetical protein